MIAWITSASQSTQVSRSCVSPHVFYPELTPVWLKQPCRKYCWIDEISFFGVALYPRFWLSKNNLSGKWDNYLTQVLLGEIFVWRLLNVPLCKCNLICGRVMNEWLVLVMDFAWNFWRQSSLWRWSCFTKGPGQLRIYAPEAWLMCWALFWGNETKPDLADLRDARGDIGDVNLELENAEDKTMLTWVEVVVSESDKEGGGSYECYMLLFPWLEMSEFKDLPMLKDREYTTSWGISQWGGAKAEFERLNVFFCVGNLLAV